MPWFRVDDGFWSHPKVLRISDGAQALWMRAGSWSMHHLTDGFIPDAALPILRAKPRFVNELRTVSLWFSVKDGNQFHDWRSYQPTREQVEADRDAAAERKRRSREKSRRDRRVTDGAGSADAAPSPSHPIPSHSSSNEEERAPRNRGTRLDPSWLPSHELVAEGRLFAPHVDLQSQTAAFVDYWVAVPGQKGLKLDWPATWRNWMRRQEGDYGKHTARGSSRLTPEERARQTLALAYQPDRQEVES